MWEALGSVPSTTHIKVLGLKKKQNWLGKGTVVIFIHHPSRGIGVDGQPWLLESPSKNKAVGFDEGVGQESASLGRTALT